MYGFILLMDMFEELNTRTRINRMACGRVESQKFSAVSMITLHTSSIRTCAIDYEENRFLISIDTPIYVLRMLDAHRSINTDSHSSTKAIEKASQLNSPRHRSSETNHRELVWRVKFERAV